MPRAWLDAYFRNGRIWCLYILFLVSGGVVTVGLINLLGDRSDKSWELCKPGLDLPTEILLLGQHVEAHPAQCWRSWAQGRRGNVWHSLLWEQNKCTQSAPRRLSAAFRCSVPAQCFGGRGAFSAILSAFQWTFQANELRHIFTVFSVSFVHV